MILKIALLQRTSCGDDQAANLAKGEDFCRRAKVLDADLALFPEMWNIGYTFFNPSKASEASEPGAREQWAAKAIERD